MTDKMLIKAEQINPVDVFMEGKYVEILDFIKQESTIEKPTVETTKGRALIKSMSAKVASSKVFIEKAGKELADNERKKIDKTLSLINDSRNFIKDCLVYWKDEVREPLTIWEAEKKAVEDAEALKVEIIKDHVEAIGHNAYLDNVKLVDEKAKQLEKERLQLEADKKATAKAEEDQKETQLSILRKQATAEAETERLKQEAIDVEKQAKIDQENAVAAAAKKVQDAADAKEKKRLEDERKVKKAEEEKAADKDHRKKIHNEILDDMKVVIHALESGECELEGPEDLAKGIIKAMVYRKIRNLSIKY